MRLAGLFVLTLITLSIALAPCLSGRTAGPPQSSPGYVLGPDDQVVIRVLQLAEIAEKPVRIGLDGKIELPYIGSVAAAGLTAEQLKARLVEKLANIIIEPQVAVTIEEFRSQPVSVIGAVNTPGIQQLHGRKSLVEVLSMAGGIRLDAGNTITITRRIENGSIPLPGSAPDTSGRFTTAKLSIKSLMEGRRPEDNIPVLPNDVISIAKAEMIYVIGEVQKAGAFVVNEQERVFMLEALSMAGGLTRTAAPQRAKILRRTAGKTITVPVNVKKVLKGENTDMELTPQDVLFIPGNTSKQAGLRAIEAVLQVGTGIAVFRR